MLVISLPLFFLIFFFKRKGKKKKKKTPVDVEVCMYVGERFKSMVCANEKKRGDKRCSISLSFSL